MELLLGGEIGRLALEANDQVLGVEAEISSVAAQKADDVGRPRKIVETALLDRAQMVVADAQNLGDLFEVVAERQPRAGQLVGDVARLGADLSQVRRMAIARLSLMVARKGHNRSKTFTHEPHRAARRQAQNIDAPLLLQVVRANRRGRTPNRTTPDRSPK